MAEPDPALRSVDVPRPTRRADVAADRPHLDARVTRWVIEMRTQIRELELANARIGAELEVADRIERGAQRVADRLEAELERARRREATLARALGYAEAERDQLARRLGEAPAPGRLRAARPGRLHGSRRHDGPE